MLEGALNLVLMNGALQQKGVSDVPWLAVCGHSKSRDSPLELSLRPQGWQGGSPSSRLAALL